jgi:hypothetical protein
MKGSPMDGVWHAASAALLQLELTAAATVDRHARYGPAVASVLAGVMAGMVRCCEVVCNCVWEMSYTVINCVLVFIVSTVEPS